MVYDVHWWIGQFFHWCRSVCAKLRNHIPRKDNYEEGLRSSSPQNYLVAQYLVILVIDILIWNYVKCYQDNIWVNYLPLHVKFQIIWRFSITSTSWLLYYYTHVQQPLIFFMHLLCAQCDHVLGYWILKSHWSLQKAMRIP